METTNNLTIKQARIFNRIMNNKELLKSIDKTMSYGTTPIEEKVLNFMDNANAYIKAIKEKRMINSIDSVSRSGMTRNIKFLSCEKNTSTSFYYRNYFALFVALGYSPANQRSHYFKISGCGMDMIFHTNYSNMHNFKTLGFISAKQCANLSQMTPSTI